MKQSKYSVLTRRLYDTFEYMKNDHSAMFVFWDNWCSEINIIGAKKSSYPWAAYDQAKAANPNSCYRLLMALDLKGSFDEQFPKHLAPTLQTLECFSMKPLIWIPDRTGVVPARKNKELIAAFLKPSLSIVAGNNDLSAIDKNESLQNSSNKPRTDHLRVVK